MGKELLENLLDRCDNPADSSEEIDEAGEDDN